MTIDPWASARTLEDLGRATAMWLRGELAETPTYLGPPDPETAEIPGGLLVGLNEAGYLTDTSQPARDEEPGYDGVLWRQRAAGVFLLDEARARAVIEAVEGADLFAIAHDPRRRPVHGGVVVTERDRYPVTGFGDWIPSRHWRCWYGRRLGRVLAGAWQVTAVDPVWGRRDALWLALAPLTRRGPRP